MAEINANKATYKTIEHHVGFTRAKFTDRTIKIINIYRRKKSLKQKNNDKLLETSIRQALQTQEGHEMLYSQLGPLGHPRVDPLQSILLLYLVCHV